MGSRPTIAFWMGSAFCAAIGLATIIVAILGADESGTVTALRVTARLSFLLFWLAYTGSAMATLFGPAFQPLRQRVREFGLAFASAHVVHLGLVAWLCWIGHAPGTSTFVLFGIAVLWTYGLAICSIGRVHQVLGRTGWWLVRTLGMNYILYAFAVDFLHPSPSVKMQYIVGYLPFSILVIAGPTLRLAAAALRFGHQWRDRSYRVG